MESSSTDHINRGADDDLIFSEAELKDIEARRVAIRDIYCTSSSMPTCKNVQENMLQIGRAQLKDALEMLEGDLKDAYKAAVKKAPHLVETESNADRFLVAHDFDPWAAARSIALYWKSRFEIFGQERACLPMDATGKGALNPEIVEGMKCRGTAVLPPDRHGRRFFYCDRSYVCTSCFQHRAQISFYLIQVLLEETIYSEMHKGFIGLICFNAIKARKTAYVDRNKPVTNVLNFLQAGVIPLRLKAFHIVNFRDASFMELFLPQWMKIVDQFELLRLRTVVHFPVSRPAAMAEFSQYGFIPEHVPKHVGGTMEYDTWWDEWFEQRIKFDHARHVAVLSGAVPPQPPLSKTPATRVTGTAVKIHVASSTGHEDEQQNQVHGEDGEEEEEEDDEGSEERRPQEEEDSKIPAVNSKKGRSEEARDRKRKMDRMYQRQKREREKKHTDQLLTRIDTLQKEKARLQAEEKSLEMLVGCAKRIVEDHEKVGLQSAKGTGAPSQRALPLPVPLAETQQGLLDRLLRNTGDGSSGSRFQTAVALHPQSPMFGTNAGWLGNQLGVSSQSRDRMSSLSDYQSSPGLLSQLMGTLPGAAKQTASGACDQRLFQPQQQFGLVDPQGSVLFGQNPAPAVAASPANYLPPSLGAAALFRNTFHLQQQQLLQQQQHEELLEALIQRQQQH